MDTVILAAGRNQRLQHIVPPYHKPFIVVNGRSVLAHAIDWPYRAYGGTAVNRWTGRVIVVCAPENALQTAHVINGRAMLIVQPEARGPGDALWHGLQLVRSPRVLVLMGDNITDDKDLQKFYCSRVHSGDLGTVKIGVQQLCDVERAAAFTVWNHQERRWDEKVPITEAHLEPAINLLGHNTELVTCWFGPLVLDTEKALEVLDVARVQEDGTVRPELLIGPILGDLAPDAEHVPTHTYDVDTEVLR